MGVKSFRTGTGQKKLSTEKPLYRGRAEYFRSTRRTGLSKPRIDRPPADYTLRIPYHAWGDTIGTLSLGLAEDYTTEPLTLPFSKDGGSEIESFTGQQHTSATATWGELVAPLSTDGVLYILYISGSNYTGDIAIDSITIEDGDGNLLGTIPVDIYAEAFETNSLSGQTSFTGATGFYTVLNSYTSSQGKWNIDRQGTGSSGTGPSADATGSSGGPYIYAETSGQNTGYPNRYFTLRTTDLVSSFVTP